MSGATQQASSSMNSGTRRQFLRTSAGAAGSVVLAFPQFLGAKEPNEKLNVATIGAGGQGVADTDSVARLGENIVALCDVDEFQAVGQRKKHSKAEFFRDYRKMFETMGKSIDAVIISTPDHHHAPAAMAAMRLGKPVFVQKPFAYSVHEARTLRETAARLKLATQTGSQGGAEDGLRRAIEVIQAGVLGQVREVHVWTNRPIWPQGIERPIEEHTVPPTLDWDVWIGPAPMRPYRRYTYHPARWRGWRDFGTGALGDMGPQSAYLPFRALKLGHPAELEATTSEPFPETYPKNSKVRFAFPGRGDLPPVTLWWYDGGWKPDPDIVKDVTDFAGTVPGSACLIIGDKGRLLSPDDYGAQFFLRLKDEGAYLTSKLHGAVGQVPESIPRSPGHYKEWVQACKGGDPAYSDFNAVGPMTESLLLGLVATRIGKKLEWDSANYKFKNAPDADKLLQREYRAGWTL